MHTFSCLLIFAVPTILLIMNTMWFAKILRGLKKTLAKRQWREEWKHKLTNIDSHPFVQPLHSYMHFPSKAVSAAPSTSWSPCTWFRNTLSTAGNFPWMLCLVNTRLVMAKDDFSVDRMLLRLNSLGSSLQVDLERLTFRCFCLQV